jgi:hypothetical protein
VAAPTHPLRELLEAAARGRFPPPDAAVEVLPPASGGPTDAVCAFTAHHVVAAPVEADWVHERVRRDPLTAPVSAAFLAELGSRLGAAPGTVDVVLAAAALDGPPPLELVEDGGDHPRAQRARQMRIGVRVLRTPAGDGHLILGRGLAGRLEASFDVATAARGDGLGRGLALAARHVAPEGAAVFAQVAPGNAASLRAVLAAGYMPLGAEVLFGRPEEPDSECLAASDARHDSF